jgi:hypothetical protein
MVLLANPRVLRADWKRVNVQCKQTGQVPIQHRMLGCPKTILIRSKYPYKDKQSTPVRPKKQNIFIPWTSSPKIETRTKKIPGASTPKHLWWGISWRYPRSAGVVFFDFIASRSRANQACQECRRLFLFVPLPIESIDSMWSVACFQIRWKLTDHGVSFGLGMPF